MFRKVKKYLKFVVCCALIMSLVAPSYAALSASDGSAFVTKAEFDSALADFNARLTTFEAGINSKIDSQVTSYLDRNGIWSGKSQLLVPLSPGWKDGGTQAWSMAIAPTITMEYKLQTQQTDWQMGWQFYKTDFINAGLPTIQEKTDFLVFHVPVLKFKANKSGLLKWDYCGTGGGCLMQYNAAWTAINCQLFGYNFGMYVAITAFPDEAKYNNGNFLYNPKEWRPIDTWSLTPSLSGQGESHNGDQWWPTNRWQYFLDSGGGKWNDVNTNNPYNTAVNIDNAIVTHPRLTFVEKDVTYFLQTVEQWSLYSDAGDSLYPVRGYCWLKNTASPTPWSEMLKYQQWDWKIY